jgi:hypothetical protein
MDSSLPPDTTEPAQSLLQPMRFTMIPDAKGERLRAKNLIEQCGGVFCPDKSRRNTIELLTRKQEENMIKTNTVPKGQVHPPPAPASHSKCHVSVARCALSEIG